jgi:hypothetical protein
MIDVRQKNKMSAKYCVIMLFSVNRVGCRGGCVLYIFREFISNWATEC